jgi:glutaredoxin
MKVVVLYSMKGCPFCEMIKEEFDKENISFLERDIEEYEEEYDEFVNATDNEYVPSMILLDLDKNDEATNVKLIAPERDFEDIYEGVEIVKKYLSE